MFEISQNCNFVHASLVNLFISWIPDYLRREEAYFVWRTKSPAFHCSSPDIFCAQCMFLLFDMQESFVSCFFFQVVGEFQCRELTFKSWSIITYNLLMFQVLGFCWIYLSMTFWLGFLTNDLFAYAWISFEVIMLTSLIIR